jgi:glycosyltransferase involved in cell wall biosynthesis
LKKILFLSKIDFSKPNNQGIRRKVEEEVANLCFLHEHSVVIKHNEKEVFKREFKGFFKKLKRFYFFNVMLPVQLKNYDCLYIRHFLFTPAFLFYLFKAKSVNNSLKTLLEIPTYPYAFAYKKSSLALKFSLQVDLFTMRFVRFWIDKLVLFGDKREELGVTVINIDNGIDVERVPPRIPDLDKEVFNILCLANLQPWHGFDRLIYGLQGFSPNGMYTKVHVHIVGDGPERAHLQTICNEVNVNEWVTFHGYLEGCALTEMFNKSNLALASVGMHRIKVGDGETSPLKTREYTARGIPFVYAYLDRLLENNFPYALKINADESPISINQIIEFCQQIENSEPDYTQKMRAYAEEHLSWKHLMLPIKNYIDEIK